MTATPEQQRERLIELLGEPRPMHEGYDGYADRLMANGVTVEVPEPGCGHPNHGSSDHDCSPFEPAPTYQPGDVAIASVRGVEGRVVLRIETEPGDRWVDAEGVLMRDAEVTVTSRAVVVTEASAEAHALATRREFGHESERWFREWFDALGGERA